MSSESVNLLDHVPILVKGFNMQNKMSSLALFTSNAVELQTVTINCKSWTLVKEVYKALEYGKTTKSTDVVKQLCSLENIAQKYQIGHVNTEGTTVNWLKYFQKNDYYINKEEVYELSVSSQQSLARPCRIYMGIK